MMADEKNVGSMAVKFTKPWKHYYSGDIAVFDSDTAQELVKAEIAKKDKYVAPKAG
ncbi:hypothetical protein [Shewanella surugensis]|uniref:Uncharacterized protein n=1 Tax=Shewanella surugensis TaxID=212020 RepID=A0ABT0LGP5_9GAMM|nr:hypothetical protein [Shewanella surugensis]MCL1126714.1 hypothetical protein [Shewanella surugensis]